jgi:asparagine synthase (glutamine-hydrolysing)
MCGFAGIVGSDDEQLVSRMLSQLQHRGPDDSGIERFDGLKDLSSAVLGFQRLSIIDLSSAGRQPMTNEDGSVWVVFNGEIYNFAETRMELESLGHVFRSRTDTEVVVHAYEEWGAACVERFNGMFAFAVLDRKRGRVLLVRDRLGIKPLYYAHSNGRFLFASEAKALLESPDLARRMDLQALDEYLTLGYVPGRRTMFEKIFRLEPGHLLTYDGKTLNVEQYWSIPAHTASRDNESDLTLQFHDLLVDAVRLQLISDVPLGAFLSGGLDSSAVVAIMARELGIERLKTFCVGYENRESRHDERSHAESLSRWLGTSHQSVVCTEHDAVAGLPELVWHLDEPIAEDVMPAYLRLCRAAREDVTVVLTGEGSDEFGYGYRYYGLERFRRRARFIPSALRGVILAAISRFAPSGGLKGRAANYCLSGSEVDAFLTWWTLFRPDQKRSLYGNAISSRMDGRGLAAQMESLVSHRTERGVDLVAWLEARQRLVDYVLLRSDRLSMAVGLEARVPFLDHRVVEFMSQVTPESKMHGWTGKMLLRRAVADLLPPENAERRKKPFGAPVGEWLASAVPAYLSDSRLVADGVLSQPGVQAVIDCRVKDPRRYDEQAWALVMLEVWYRVFIRQDLTVDRDLMPRNAGLAPIFDSARN